jgi:hypothetical protein
MKNDLLEKSGKVFCIRELRFNVHEAFDLLNQFNPNVHPHVDRPQGLNCKGGEVYFFYRNPKKYKDYTTDD